jgi:hypothetical protein
MRDSLGRDGQVCGSGISFLDDFVGPRFIETMFIGTKFIGRAILGGDFIPTKFIPAEFRGTESNRESSAQNLWP